MTSSYLVLGLPEIRLRAERAIEELSSCRVCPRNCGVDRLEDKRSVCRSGRYAAVSSAFAHFGEENPLRGRSGSGTIFFSHCNLKCVFCQNWDISQGNEASRSETVRPEELAAIMLSLQRAGCHNINFVTPEHVVPQILEALVPAVEGGLTLPIVYNTGAYDSLRSLELLNGIVDIYMPDFKYWSSGPSGKYLKAPDYPEVARAAIKEMQRQVGDLQIDESGLATRGLLIRHLVMPGALDETRRILEWILKELGPNTYLNLMDQYYPAGSVSSLTHPELNRRLTSNEFRQAQRMAKEGGLRRLD